MSENEFSPVFSQLFAILPLNVLTQAGSRVGTKLGTEGTLSA